MNKKVNLLFCLFHKVLLALILSFSLLARDLSLEESAVIYRSENFRNYLKDLALELENYDGLPQSTERDEVKKHLEQFIQDGDYEDFSRKIPETWKNFFKLSTVDFAGADKGHVREVETQRPTSTSKHTLNAPSKYVDDRLGQVISENVARNRQELIIHAGEAEHLGEVLPKDSSLVRVPSLYENWGIEKFAEVSSLSTSTPQIVVNIPPIEEYAEHYAQMIALRGGESKVYINEHDRLDLKRNFQQEIDELYKKYKIPEGVHVALGYQQKLEETLGQSKEWELVESVDLEKSEKLKIGGKKLRLKNTKNPKIQIEVLSLAADSTLWGEATSFLAEAVLEKKPKSINFFGSAGLIATDKGRVYDASIPENFFYDGKRVDLTNQFSSIKGPQIISGITHGNSSSPSEQDELWLKEQRAKGIQSVDVEVSRMAQTVADYNKRNLAQVSFGVINLITDRPSLEHGDELDLSKIDPKAKGQAQKGITSLFWDELSKIAQTATLDDSVIRSHILRHLPGINPEDIKIKNGVGRIDASKEHKQSFYVMTENPGSKNQSTYLIPMATSRYDRYNYHTDEWWDKHGEAYSRGEKVPLEDPVEVTRYLKEHNLSTNPDVVILEAQSGNSKKVKLQDFLLEEYLKSYEKDGFVTLYRGVAKDTEVADWKAGKLPKGTRYWTPDLNYAWRYGRKRNDLIDGLIRGESPMVKFRVPKAEFISMIKKGELVLGTELPKSAHKTFDQGGEYIDSLTNKAYLGDERFGLEMEIRARRPGRQKMINYFAGTVEAGELVQDRIEKIRSTYTRLAKLNPAKSANYQEEMNGRIKQAWTEYEVIRASQEGKSSSEIAEIAKELRGEKELAHTSREELVSVAKEKSGKYKMSGDACQDKLLRELLL